MVVSKTNKEVYLLRHGATVLHGLYVGSTDTTLSEEGRKQVMRTGKILARETIQHIYCSPMKRCLETLDILQLDAPFEIDENLREIDFGRWEGLSFKEIAQTDARLVEQWRIGGESFCFPEGECIKAFNSRVNGFAERAVLAPCSRVLIIAHGGTIRHLLCTFLGLSPEKRMVFDIHPGGVSTVALYGGQGALTSLNAKGQR